MAARYHRSELLSAKGLLAALGSIFPEFGDEELIREIEAGEASLHAIMREFAYSFRAATSTRAQLIDLASLVGQATAETDTLENAVGTCFLEHLHQIDRQGMLWEYLSPEVKAYVRRH